MFAASPFSTTVASAAALAAVSGCVSRRNPASMAAFHASSKLRRCPRPYESVELNRAALPLLLSTETIWRESTTIKFEPKLPPLNSIPSGIEKMCSLPMHWTESINLTRTPLVRALTIDGLHCETSLIPQPSRAADTDVRELLISSEIFARADSASSSAFPLSPLAFGLRR